MLLTFTHGLERSRELCPYLPNEVHILASKIAQIIWNEHPYLYYFPGSQDLFLTLLEFSEKNSVTATTLENFLLLVDRIEEDYPYGEKFSAEFRQLYKDVLGITPPYVITKREFSEPINFAVNWWANEILFRRDIDTLPEALQKTLKKNYTQEEKRIFTNTLAIGIRHDLKYKKDGVNLHTGYKSTSKLLMLAGNKVGVHPLLGYPPTLAMCIYSDEVAVSTDAGYHWKHISFPSK